MKIAIISNTSFNIYNFRLGLMLFLQSKGYEVVYIAPYDEYVNKIAEKTNFQYIPLQHMSRKGYNPLSELLLIDELRRIYKKHHIDLTLSYTIKPNIYSALATVGRSTKAICNITGLGYVFLKRSIGNAIAKQLFKIALKRASMVVFQNSSDQELFIQQGICAAEKTLIINGSGINLDTYKPLSTDNAPHPFNFLFIGRLLYDKGIREFIGAAQRMAHHDVVFNLVGALDQGNPSAVSEDELKEWLAHNPKLVYHGHQQEVIPFIQEADAVVLPSYREGIPRVLLEAMAMKKPFITTDAPGCKDVTHDGKNGLLVSTGSEDELSQAMNRLFTMSAEERQEMGNYGRTWVEEKYDEKIIVQEYLKLILRLTNS